MVTLSYRYAATLIKLFLFSYTVTFKQFPNRLTNPKTERYVLKTFYYNQLFQRQMPPKPSLPSLFLLIFSVLVEVVLASYNTLPRTVTILSSLPFSVLIFYYFYFFFNFILKKVVFLISYVLYPKDTLYWLYYYE